MNAPFAGGMKGDYARGQKFYLSNCAECHGETGKGDGRRAYFMVYKPKDFTSEKARAELNRPHLFTGISKGVTGTGMPAWSKVIDDQQIADVAEYVFRTFIRPTAQAAPSGTQPVPGPSWQPPPEKKK
jgi:mono/diheme cytochrome c family protein